MASLKGRIRTVFHNRNLFTRSFALNFCAPIVCTVHQFCAVISPSLLGEDRGGPVESRGGPAPPQLKRVLRHGSVPSFKHVECVRNSSATRVSMRFWNTALRRRSCHPRRLLRALFDESHDSSAGTVERLSPEPCPKQRPAGRKVSKLRTGLGLTYP